MRPATCMFYLCLIMATDLLAQTGQQRYSISGQVISSQTLTAVRVNLSVLYLQDHRSVETVADSAGFYTFNNLPSGLYLLKASAAGFISYNTDTVRVINKNLVLQLQLTPDHKALKEVVVQSKKPLLSVEQGKLVMDLGNNSTAAGSNAWDLLKKLPGITVGSDDNIMLRGNAGINVMIDGRMSYLSGKQLTNLLQGIAGDNLSRIELLTTPPAEYDAAGNGGIINIITRRQKNKAYAIDLRSGITKGWYWMSNQNVSASVQTGKINLYGMFDYNTPHSFTKSRSGNTLIENGDSLAVARDNTAFYKIRYYTYRAGLKWEPIDHHQFGLHYHGYFDDFFAGNTSSLSKTDRSQSLRSTLNTISDIDEPYYYDALNLHYQFDWDSTRGKLAVDAHGINYRNYSDGLMTTTTLLPGGTPAGQPDQLRSHQPGFIRIRSFKADLELTPGNYLVKTGLKYASVSNDNNYRFDSLQMNNWIPAGSMSNHFKYTEKVSAAYASVARKWAKTAVTAGIRFEYTDATGLTVDNGFIKTWHYLSVFPSLSADRQLNEDNKLNLSISRRINRPVYADLNPVRWYNDPLFYYSGNPGLVPEMAWIFALSNTFRSKYIMTASYSRRNNYMSRLLLTDSMSGSISSQTANFPGMDRVDILLSAPVDLAMYWSVQATAGINYSRYPVSSTGKQQFLQQWAGTLTIIQQFKLPLGLQADFSMYSFSNDLWGVYRRYKTWYADLGLRRSFFNKQLDAVINCTDLFNTNRFKGQSLDDRVDYRYYDKRDTRRLSVSLRYHFGGTPANKKATRIEEQDRL